MAFTYQKKESGEKAYIEVTGFAGNTRLLRIPEEIDGLPVKSIAANAFSWREDIKEAILPERLETVRGFAFYNSSGLSRIALHDGIEDYYDGVIRHCRQLSEIDVTMEHGNYGLLKAMLADNDRCLRLTIRLGEDRIRLTFPEYYSDYIEDTRARAFHTKIEGAGYVYRECVTSREIRFQEYDDIFVRAFSDDAPAASMIAIDRLRFPYRLSESARNRYGDYLRSHMRQILLDLISKEDTESIDALAGLGMIPEEACREGIRLAAKQEAAGICARLMEVQKGSRRPAGRLRL